MSTVSPISRFSCICILFVVVLTTSLPLVGWLLGASWHDQQRIGQVLACALALAAAGPWVLAGPYQVPLLTPLPRRLIALVLAAALLSSLIAPQPVWALTELALGVACLGLAWVTALMRRRWGATADHLLLAVLAFTCAGLMARLLAAYVAATLGDAGVLDAWLLVDGFSNPRFYGQFLTLALPLLVAPLLCAGRWRRYAVPAGLLLVLVWAAAITSGTRGTWLGLACAVAALACIGPQGRRWALLQVLAAAAGLVLFWLALSVVPDLLGLSVGNHAAARLTTSLSGREIIWSQAAEEALRHPLLGIGPMQLANLPNGVAAHPHQALLQWAAELGLPSALIVIVLVLRAAWALIPVLRQRAASASLPDVLRLCLAGSLLGALAQAMVDGVLVMPYSQLWLALLAGWLLGLQPEPERHAAQSPWGMFAWLGLYAAAVAMLGFVVVRDYPHLEQREEAFARDFGGHYQPRFWAQGVIAQKPR